MRVENLCVRLGRLLLAAFGMLTLGTIWAVAEPHESKSPPPLAAGQVWPSEPPADCPFKRSDAFGGLQFTGRHAEYTNADTWYPSWAGRRQFVFALDRRIYPLVTYLKEFEPEAYFVNVPTKFIAADGRTFWLCYSANWSKKLDPGNPPGSCYGLSLQEVKLVGPMR